MKVSVVIPAYNRASLLKRAIESVITQTYQDFEIIVVDDASTDNTEAIVSELAFEHSDHKIHYVKHIHNRGEAGARNSGVKAATGELVAFLDSDDEWLPEKLWAQIDFLKTHKADGVFCECYISERGNEVREHIKTAVDEIKAHELFTKGCGFGAGTNLLIKRECITEFFDESLKLFVDMGWLYQIAQKSKILVLHSPLSIYYKSPMRSGDYIKHHAKIFLMKFNDEFKTFSVWQRISSYAVINWYIAIAYDFHRQYRPAIYHYGLGLCFNPIRRPGNYLHLLKLAYLMIKEKIWS